MKFVFLPKIKINFEIYLSRLVFPVIEYLNHNRSKYEISKTVSITSGS